MTFAKKSILPVSIALLALAGAGAAANDELPPAQIEHAAFDALLREYVDDQGLVDYARWKASPTDLERLETYLKRFAEPAFAETEGDERIAALINAYNGFTLSFLLENYPTESIRLLPNPFDGKRHILAGESVSVDDIEHRMLRPLIGWKVHAVVVCAARSCPPLLHRAYLPDTWESQMRERYRSWLARQDLNRYSPGAGGSRGSVEISSIFKWYRSDFDGEASVEAILTRFGPPEMRSFFESGHYRIRFMDYHWGLNDQGALGEGYRHSIWRSLF